MRVTTTVTDEAVGFDGLRAVVGAGDGVVGRFPGIVCVAHCPDPEPLREFLALCADVAGREPGRLLARRLATWMSSPDAPGPQLRFGTVAAAGDQLAVFLVGDVDARVDDVGGLTLSGAHAAVGTDRLLPRPTAPVVLSLNGAEVRNDPADVHDLRAGIVPGAGVVLWTAGFELDDREHAGDEATVGHEWFDTGEATSDPFGSPLRAPDVPVQRAGAGRNGAAQTAEPEAAAAADEREDGETGRPAAGPSGRPGIAAEDEPLVEPEHGSDPEPDELFDWSDPASKGDPFERPDQAREVGSFDGDDWRGADRGSGTQAGRHALEAPAGSAQDPMTDADPLSAPRTDPPTSDERAVHPFAGYRDAPDPRESPRWTGSPGEGSRALDPSTTGVSIPLRTVRRHPADTR